MLTRRPTGQPGHLTEGDEELELTYLLRRHAWGPGLAFEAATATLRTAAAELPDCRSRGITQAAGQCSLNLATRLGFQPVGTFEAHGAQQTLAVTLLHAFDT